jgi:nucleoside phosphorylase
VVGIAGGLPSDDISLGDVVLSTRVLDFSVEARKFQEDTTYNVGGGPIAKSIAAGVANLSARDRAAAAGGFSKTSQFEELRTGPKENELKPGARRCPEEGGQLPGIECVVFFEF